jgi:cytochrome c556
MKPFVTLLAAAGLAVAMATAVAAPRLKPIMHDWKAMVASAEPMLTGAAPYDEAELRRILTVLVSNSHDIQAGIASKSAQALDIKRRFSQFEADAAATLQSLGAKDQAKTQFLRMRGDCRACHDAFAN